MRPERRIGPLQVHLAKVQALHQRDLEAGFGEVYMPDALAVKDTSAQRGPNAPG
jgi:hypothetical protein